MNLHVKALHACVHVQLALVRVRVFLVHVLVPVEA
jgi:hypothetical protein